VLPAAGLVLLLLLACWAFLASTLLHRKPEPHEATGAVRPPSGDTSALPAK